MAPPEAGPNFNSLALAGGTRCQLHSAPKPPRDPEKRRIIRARTGSALGCLRTSGTGPQSTLSHGLARRPIEGIRSDINSLGVSITSSGTAPRAHVTQRVGGRPANGATPGRVSREDERRDKEQSAALVRPKVSFIAWAEDPARAQEVARAWGGRAYIVHESPPVGDEPAAEMVEAARRVPEAEVLIISDLLAMTSPFPYAISASNDSAGIAWDIQAVIKRHPDLVSACPHAAALHEQRWQQQLNHLREPMSC